MLPTLIKSVLHAGAAVLKIYNENDYDVESKADDSPLTTADIASNKIINQGLSGLGIPVLSEENKEVPYDERKNWDEFFLVDPLDGTKEFIKRNGEFTVNLALVKGNTPVLGIIYAPVPDILYWGSREEGSWKLENASQHEDKESMYAKAVRLPETQPDPEYLRVVASKSHFSEETEEYIQSLDPGSKKIELVSRGSSLKLCMVAEGSADVYPRLGPTMEWDTGAGHAIAKYAGCEVKVWNSVKEMEYNKENLLNPWFIVSPRPKSPTQM